MTDDELLKKYPAIEELYERTDILGGSFLYEELIDFFNKQLKKYEANGGLGQPLFIYSEYGSGCTLRGKRLESRAKNLKRAKTLEQRALHLQEQKLQAEQEEREELTRLLNKYGANMDTRQ